MISVHLFELLTDNKSVPEGKFQSEEFVSLYKLLLISNLYKETLLVNV